MHGADAKAWTVFWQEQGASSRCCANAPAEMRRALDDHWRSFAATLSPKSTVLDIGCGAGAVGRALLAAEPLLRVTGIDLATLPPSEDKRIEIRSNTPMETLDFAAGSFDAAVSQFGYEYGNTDQAAGAIARVLKPGAPISFLVHHSDSPINADRSVHLRALEQLCGTELQTAFMSGEAVVLDHKLSRLRQQCPGLAIVEQAARGLSVRVKGNYAQRGAVWEAIAEALAPEIIMLKALEASCVTSQELERWLEPLVQQFEINSPTTVTMKNGEPIAWRIEGKRR